MLANATPEPSNTNESAISSAINVMPVLSPVPLPVCGRVPTKVVAVGSGIVVATAETGVSVAAATVATEVGVSSVVVPVTGIVAVPLTTTVVVPETTEVGVSVPAAVVPVTAAVAVAVSVPVTTVPVACAGADRRSLAGAAAFAPEGSGTTQVRIRAPARALHIYHDFLLSA